MLPSWQRLRSVAAALATSALLLCQGCASLKPSETQVPPDYSGGMKVSENARAGIGYFGDVLYYFAMFFHTL